MTGKKTSMSKKKTLRGPPMFFFRLPYPKDPRLNTLQWKGEWTWKTQGRFWALKIVGFSDT